MSNLGSIDIASEAGCHGGGNNPTTEPARVVIAGINTSAMTGGNGTAGWLYAPGFMRPTDALIAKGANAIGVLTTGVVVTAGRVADAKFTTEGGKPAVGQPVYLAPSTDDTGTGSGKFTATRPNISTPIAFQPQDFPENVTIVGKVVDPSAWDAAKTCVIDLVGPATPEPAELVGQSWTSNKIAPFSATQYLSADGTQTYSSFKEEESIAILFSVDDSSLLATNYLWWNIDTAVHGWVLVFEPAGVGFKLHQIGAADTNIVLGQPRAGYNCIAATIRSGVLSASLNGGQPVSTAMLGAALGGGAGAVMNIGKAFTVGTSFNAGSVIGCAKLTRALTGNELMAIAATPIPSTPRNRFVFPDLLLQDAALQWHSDAKIFTGGSGWLALDRLGTTIVFTWGSAPSLPGGPLPVAIGDQWIRQLLPYMLDSEPHFNDSRNRPRGDPLARVAFTTPAAQRDVLIRFENDDFDNADNGCPSVFIDGVLTTDFLIDPVPDGEPHGLWIPLGTVPGAHLVEIVTPDKVDREAQTGGLLSSGSCLVDIQTAARPIFQTAAIARRLIMVGDDATIGHDAGIPGTQPASGCATTALRADYPGRVTAHAATSRSLYLLYQASGVNSIIPFARELRAVGKEGGATTVDVWISLGFIDYFRSFATIAQFIAVYQTLVDTLHFLEPTWTIYAQRLIQAGYDAIANTNGETLAQFNTAIAGLSTGRPWLTVADARLPTAITFNGVTPLAAFQPTQPGGALAWKNNIKAIIGY